MKKLLITLSLSAMFLAGRITPVIAQDQPKPQKDTVNMDTNAKPEFYYSVEDEQAKKSGISAVVIVAVIAGVAVVGAVAFFLLKKKK